VIWEKRTTLIPESTFVGLVYDGQPGIVPQKNSTTPCDRFLVRN
jgi:hypothetical protein